MSKDSKKKCDEKECHPDGAAKDECCDDSNDCCLDETKKNKDETRCPDMEDICKDDNDCCKERKGCVDDKDKCFKDEDGTEQCRQEENCITAELEKKLSAL